MTTSATLRAVEDAWNTVSDDPPTRLRGSQRIVNDLTADSLQATEFVVCLERSLSVSILGDSRLDDVRTIDDLCQLLDELRGEESA